MVDANGPTDGARAVVVVVHDGRRTVLGVVSRPRPDLALVDTLAHLQLAARRLGACIRVEHPCDELRELLALAGLDDLLIDDGPIDDLLSDDTPTGKTMVAPPPP